MEITAADLYTFIDQQPLAVLATISPDNLPQAALVGIAVSPSLEIVFDTLKSTRKYRNLQVNKTVAFTIGWAGEITVQYEGEASDPQGSELARYREIYFRKWPDGPSRLSWPGLVHIAVRPKWIRYSDFNQSPPWIQEMPFR